MTRRLLALLLAAATLPVLSSSTSAAATTFTFYGSGYGHGIGLSQWGSYGLAVNGWSHQKILAHFYQKTKVGPAPSSPSRLRIGLVQEAKTVHLTATQGSVTLRVGTPGGKVIGRPIKQGETWRVIVDGSGRYRVIDAAGKSVGGLWGGLSQNIFANYAGAKLLVRESGHTYNRGYIEFNLYRSNGCAKVSYCQRLIIVLMPQAYLFGLAEVPSSWPMEALATQADAARTYAFEKAGRLGQHRPVCNCALYDDTRDQVFAGWDKEGGPQGSRWVAAVDNTNGEVVLYKGAPIQAYYYSSSGGYTENNENVWGGTPLPYLRGVCDPGDYTQQNPSAVWTVGPLSNVAVASALRRYTGNIGNVVSSFTNYVRGVSGRIITITVVGTQGRQATIAGWQIRAGLVLKDDKIWINANRNITGGIRTKYDGLMCAPGLAASRPLGIPGGVRQRFADGTIYWNTAAASASWEQGPVYVKYLALGEAGPGDPLGLPTSDVTPLHPSGCDQIDCAMSTFDKGNIYFKQGLGDGSAHELHGYVLGYYLLPAVGGYAGHLGFPVTDVSAAPDGSTSAKFESGATVTCPPNGPADQCVETGGSVNLALRISDSPDPVRLGRILTYVLTVRNSGPSSATRVVLTDALPAGVRLLSKRASHGTCIGTRIVSCSLGSILAGRTVTVTLTVRTTARGRIRDTGHVRAKETDPRVANNSATIRTRVM